MSIPGAFTRDFSDSDLDESYHMPPAPHTLTGTAAGDDLQARAAGQVSSSQAEHDQAEIDDFLDQIDDDDDSEGDLDFLPDSDLWGANVEEDEDEEGEGEVMIEEDEIEEEEILDEQEEEEETAGPGGGRQLQIGYDGQYSLPSELGWAPPCARSLSIVGREARVEAPIAGPARAARPPLAARARVATSSQRR